MIPVRQVTERRAVQQWSSNDPRGFRSCRHSDRALISGTYRNIKCTKEDSHTRTRLLNQLKTWRRNSSQQYNAGIKTALWLWGWCDDLGLCQEKKEEADAKVFTGEMIQWSASLFFLPLLPFIISQYVFHHNGAHKAFPLRCFLFIPLVPYTSLGHESKHRANALDIYISLTPIEAPLV